MYVCIHVPCPGLSRSQLSACCLCLLLQFVYAGKKAVLSVGNTLPLGEMPEGTIVCNVEAKAGDRGTLARCSGDYVIVVAHNPDSGITRIKLPSGAKKVGTAGQRWTGGQPGCQQPGQPIAAIEPQQLCCCCCFRSRSVGVTYAPAWCGAIIGSSCSAVQYCLQALAQSLVQGGHTLFAVGKVDKALAATANVTEQLRPICMVLADWQHPSPCKMLPLSQHLAGYLWLPFYV